MGLAEERRSVVQLIGHGAQHYASRKWASAGVSTGGVPRL